MKKLSRLNKSSISSIIVGLSGIVFVAAAALPARPPEPAAGYHYSLWNEYVPDIERALVGNTKDPLSINVYGGMVPHHIPTTIPKLVAFYQRLARSESVERIIIIGPDHTDSGRTPIVVSNRSFSTSYGDLHPIPGVPQTLQDQGIAQIDESPFEKEHSVGSQILVISRIFPEAAVTPIILRSDVSAERAEMLGNLLSEFLDEKTILIASVDFSHYLSASQAMPIDHVSADILANLDTEAFRLIEADSNQSVRAFMQAMKARNARETEGIEVLNTNDFMQNADYTTGYVFGYWGTKQ